MKNDDFYSLYDRPKTEGEIIAYYEGWRESLIWHAYWKEGSDGRFVGCTQQPLHEAVADMEAQKQRDLDSFRAGLFELNNTTMRDIIREYHKRIS